MAVKNGVEFFPEAVASIRRQEHIDYELLVGLNGDPMPKIPWERTDRAFWGEPIVRELKNAHSKAQAINELLKDANGDAVAILDVDDIWMPGKLARQVPFLEQYDVVGTQGDYFGTAHGRIPIPCGDVSFSDLLVKNCLINSSALMRRECADPWPDVPLVDDYKLWLELAWNGKRLYNLSGPPLTRIRYHDNQHAAGRNNPDALVAEYRKRVRS